jgi:Na+-translocating ferredoxin:NAD+ oxidoreductase subunit C
MLTRLRNRLRGVKAFPRGIHPPHRKYTEALPIELFVPSGPVTIPLSQHIGAAGEPCVKPKQAVGLGEKIADATAFVTAPIHASVNGVIGVATVTAVPGGRRVPAIPLKPQEELPLVPADFIDRYLERDWGRVEPSAFEPELICDRIRAGGIVGLGGATFPTHIKLKRNPERPVDTLILNGCECEPYLTGDHRMMVEAPEAVVCGVALAAQAAGVERCLLVIEENKPDAIDALRRASAELPHVEVVVAAAQYPMGGERQLIYAVTGRTVPAAPKGLPLDVGCVVINVATAHAIAHAVVHERPLTHRVVSVTGQGVENPGNFLTPIGTPIKELIEHAAGGIKRETFTVLAGGPMMGMALPHLDIPVVKGSGGLTVMLDRETAHWRESPCIRCGRCIDNCPLYLSPRYMALAVKHRDYELADQYNLMSCCECGCCAYECPAGIPLTQYMKAGKQQLRVIAAQQKAKADAARASAAPCETEKGRA